MSIQFGEACKDLFKTEGKWMTLLGLFVCMLIPIVGPMVAIGFLFRRFTRERQGHPTEDFDFNFFADYLKMGLWPTIATLVFSLVAVPIILVFAFLPAVLIPLMEEASEAAAIVVAVVAFTIYIGALILLTLASCPILIRSGLMMDFKAGFSFSFIKGFLGKVGLSLIGYYLLLMLISFPLLLVGYLALVIGVYVVSAWLQVATMHLVYQHYELSVERGGEKIEINPELTKELATPPLPSEQPALQESAPPSQSGEPPSESAPKSPDENQPPG
ncbi:MAG: DUF4013 domain-containing protein [Verrucomicrobiota bacterium]